jgi:putative endonuclease
MHYTYELSSEKDGRFYIGTTRDLRSRLKLHAQGHVTSTAYRRPLSLAYYEACHSADDAYRRERYLKSGRGGRYLKQRLAGWLSHVRDNKLERH